MNNFLLTISGMLFLLTSGLSKPTFKPCSPIEFFGIDKHLESKVTCDDKVTFVTPLENRNFSAAAKCYQNQLNTIRTNCKINGKGLIDNAYYTLEQMVQKDAECIFEINVTVSYSSFVKKFKNLIQQYNTSKCSGQK